MNANVNATPPTLLSVPSRLLYLPSMSTVVKSGPFTGHVIVEGPKYMYLIFCTMSEYSVP